MRRPPKEVDSQPASCYDSSMSSENDNNLINFIATTVEALRDQMATMRDEMATKVDLANLRDEMATKQDLARVESNLETLRGQVATKDDVARVESRLETLREQMATKNDLGRLETTMHGEFEQVHIRFDSMDRRVDTRMGQIETDVSRLRSVVYLLVKDKPDMLRLLGQPTPPENPPHA
jgi:hypothetical protein